MQAAHIIGGVGNRHLVGKVAYQPGNDFVAHFLLVARFFDEAGSGFVRCVRAVPDFRPAEHRQRCGGKPATAGLDQVELAFAVLVGFVTGRAEIQWQGDMAIEGNDPVLHVVSLLHDAVRVTGVVVEHQVPGQEGGTGANGQGQRQADAQSFFRAQIDHCHL
ncbi:hypothetical protein D3C76_1325350 [compost metagenome]